MTETNIIMSMKFDKTNFFILYTNTEYTEKLAGAMALNYLGC